MSDYEILRESEACYESEAMAALDRIEAENERLMGLVALNGKRVLELSVGIRDFLGFLDRKFDDSHPWKTIAPGIAGLRAALDPKETQ